MRRGTVECDERTAQCGNWTVECDYGPWNVNKGGLNLIR